MAQDFRVFNVTRGFRLRFNQALKAVENCVCAWVDYGATIRDLTLAEAIAARNEQAKRREPLPYAEIHGLHYEPPTGGDATYRQGRLLAYEASLFAGLTTDPQRTLAR